MSLKTQSKELPAFDREIVFAEVDASNRRFDGYTKAQRKVFATEARSVKMGKLTNEVSRS